MLRLLVHFNSLFVDVLLLLLLVNQRVCRLIQLVDVVAQVLRRRELKQVRVEGWHLRLDVVEKVGLHEVAAVDADRDLFEKLMHGHILRSDTLLNQVDLI